MEYGTNDWFSYSSRIGYGRQMYSCQDCPYYTFENEARMLDHCRKTGHGLQRELPDFEQWKSEHQGQLRPVIITLGYLCWNTCRASEEGMAALIQEADKLTAMGCTVHLIAVDNGSTDGTAEALGKVSEGRATVLPLLDNIGISKARNIIVDDALRMGSDYLLLLDGDIEVVPYSTFHMARYLECHRDVGCIGAYSGLCSPERDRCAQWLSEIPESKMRQDIKCAWTQYGLFRCQMFRDGIRFDEGGPFGEPGWGFEDDDLFWQMKERGYGNRYFGGMCYLHRNLRSSWPNLRRDGIDPKVAFKKRKEYLISKWSKALNPDIMNSVRGQQAPVGA